MLMQLIESLDDVDGIVAYSISQLPAEAKKRTYVYDAILKQSREMHFAVEGLSLFDSDSAERIETLIRVKHAVQFLQDV